MNNKFSDVDRGSPPIDYQSQLAKDQQVLDAIGVDSSSLIDENVLDPRLSLRNTSIQQDVDEEGVANYTEKTENTEIEPITHKHEPNIVQPIPKSKTKIESTISVKLENSIFEFTFKAASVSETELAYAFLLEPDAFNIKPKADTEFTLTYNHKQETVFYISPPFEFDVQELHILLLIKNIQEDEEGR